MFAATTADRFYRIDRAQVSPPYNTSKRILSENVAIFSAHKQTMHICFLSVSGAS